MRVEKDGQAIRSMEDWRRLAGPKSPAHWVEHRSAFELARAWFSGGVPAIPLQLRVLLDSREETRHLRVDVVHPEHRISFDSRRGEPRNADLAFVGTTAHNRVAVTVEAKADEPFGSTLADALADAAERKLANARSAGVERIQDLVQSLLRPREGAGPHIRKIRYQLLTAVAGTLGYAVQQDASTAVLVIHEFATSKTTKPLREKNARDLAMFMGRLSPASCTEAATTLIGPISVPGLPLFERAPALFVGKIITDQR